MIAYLHVGDASSRSTSRLLSPLTLCDILPCEVLRTEVPEQIRRRRVLQLLRVHTVDDDPGDALREETRSDMRIPPILEQHSLPGAAD